MYIVYNVMCYIAHIKNMFFPSSKNTRLKEKDINI